MSMIELELIEELFSPSQKMELIQQLKNAMALIRNENLAGDARNADDQADESGGSRSAEHCELDSVNPLKSRVSFWALPNVDG